MKGILTVPLRAAAAGLARFLPPVLEPRGPRRVGTCGGCYAGVYTDQPHEHYRGEVYHRQPCLRDRRRGDRRA